MNTVGRPGSQPSSGSQGSNGSVTGGFELVSSGMAMAAGASPPCSTVGGMSMTDVTLEQALVRMQELAKENNELRDYLKENNEMMKKQFETLSQWKEKVHAANTLNRDKFEQTKAVITALRADNEDLQRKVAESQNKELTLMGKFKTLEAELSTLHSAKATSDQLAYNVVKQAEKQGVAVGGEEAQMREMVFVASAEKEERIMQLEQELSQKTEALEQMKERQAQLEKDIAQFRQHTDQLLKDAEATQTLKQEIQQENQELRQENLQLQKQVQTLLAESKNSLQRTQKSAFNYGMPLSGQQQGKGAGNGNIGDIELTGEETGTSPSRTADDWQEESNAVTAEVAQLQQQLEAEKQKVALKLAEIETKEVEIQQLKEQVMMMNTELENCQSRHEERMRELQIEHDAHVEEIEKQRTGDSSQQQQQVLEATYTEDIQTLRSQVLTLINEVHDIQNKLSAALRSVEMKNGRIKELENYSTQLVEDSRRQIQQLQQALMNTEKNVSTEQQNHGATKQQMNELRKSFNQLVSDYKEVLDTFDQYKAEQEQRNNVSANQKQLMEKVNYLTAQLVAAEEALNAREDKIKKLEADVKDKDETITVFQAQAEVYQSDFTAERDARARLATERDQLASDMEALQLRNQQLTDQLTQYAQRQLADLQLRANQGGGYSAYSLQRQYPQQDQQYPQADQRYPQADQRYPQADQRHPQADQRYPQADQRYPQAEQGASGGGGGTALNNLNAEGGGYNPQQNANFHGNPAYGGRPGYNPYYHQAGHGGYAGGTHFGELQDNRYPQPRSVQPGSIQPSQHDEEEPQQEFICPSCDQRFPDLDTLNIHVTDCLDQQEAQQRAS